MTILTVDDSATLRKMVGFTLRSAGYEVVEAGDGAEGVAALKANHVDIVITDLNMPNMDGLEFTRSARAMSEHAKTPILVLTTESEGEKKAKLKEAGATGWVVKPFTPDQLLAIVARVAEMVAKTRAAA